MATTRNKSAHTKWSKQVKQRAQSVCQYCGTTDRLEAHHIVPVHIAPDLELSIDNGVCLCHHHHLAAHGGIWSDKGRRMQTLVTNVEIQQVRAFVRDMQEVAE